MQYKKNKLIIFFIANFVFLLFIFGSIVFTYKFLINKNLHENKSEFVKGGIIINPENNRRILPVLMTEVEKLNKGDIFRHEMSGGGGFGNPLEREEDLVLKDLIEEKIDIKNAKKDYGVVFKKNKNKKLSVDKKLTKVLRKKLSGNIGRKKKNEN